jgi:hypothetical protein
MDTGRPAERGLAQARRTASVRLVTLTGPEWVEEALIRVTTDPGSSIQTLEAPGFAVREAWRG